MKPGMMSISILLLRHEYSPALIRLGFRHLFDDSHGAMRLFMWHLCQKDVASCLLQLLDGIDETLT